MSETHELLNYICGTDNVASPSAVCKKKKKNCVLRAKAELINTARFVIPSTLVFQARSEFEDIKEFVILDARVCAKDSRGRLLARSNRIRTTDTCVVLHTLQEKHLRELNENAYSPRAFSSSPDRI